MIRPIRDAMGGAFTSFDALASELLKAEPTLEWPARRSLSVKIGELDRGTRTWWQRRPEHLKALLKLLQIPEADVGLHEGASEREHFTFKEFPELPPLHLRREAPLRLGRGIPDGPRDATQSLDDWLNHSSDGPTSRKPLSDITWLQIAEGTDRGTLLAELSTKGGFEVIRVRKLGDVGHRLEDATPLVIQLAEQADVSDLRHLLKRPSQSSALILASSPFPHGNDRALNATFSWDFLTAENPERGLIALSNPRSSIGMASPLQVSSLTWKLDEDWDTKLLNWVEARLNKFQIDTLFSAQGLQKWIDAFDPQRHWIRTPEELMVLCRICHRTPERELPRPSDRHVADALLGTVLSMKPVQARVFRKLVENRWQTINLPWLGALPETTWRTLAGGSDVISPDALLEIAEASNREKRREMAMLVAERSNSGTIDALIEDSYLTHEGGGRYNLTPPALANLIIRDWLIEHITTSPLAVWASACFDEPRRRLVEATLECLSVAELSGLAESLHQEPLWSANAIAVSESLVLVTARRLAQGEQYTESLHHCMRQVLSRLTSTETTPNFTPLTRSLDAPEEQLNWLLTCWAWSLTPRPADLQISAQDGWQFPGWFVEPPTESASRALILVQENEVRPASWSLLMKLGRKLTERWKSPPAFPPYFLAPALLEGVAKGRWNADSTWWSDLRTSKKVENDFLTRVQPEGKAVCLRLWPSLLQHEVDSRNEYVSYLNCVTSPTRQWILRSLNPAEILCNLTDETLSYLRRNAVTIPPSIRSMLLDQLSDDAPEAYELLKVCEELDCFDLMRWLKGSTQEIAAERVWRRPSEEIACLLRNISEITEDAVEAIFRYCPDQHIEVALEALEGASELLAPSFRRYWVSRQMACSRQFAQRLIAIIQPQLRQTTNGN